MCVLGPRAYSTDPAKAHSEARLPTLTKFTEGPALGLRAPANHFPSHPCLPRVWLETETASRP